MMAAVNWPVAIISIWLVVGCLALQNMKKLALIQILRSIR
ncbi:MAG: hypothetical protein CM1200mP39_16570 [Dehalococcoidia bacterium]|nr:MAG: hypothetical protein CM1200mP39_16570 [Dehalococcoidia bacterium]